jgi:type II secretory pathway pseudopilin PulG
MILNIFKKKKNYYLAGFTLIELTTSLLIISLMVGVFLANYRAADSQVDLILTSQILASDIRYAQANALGLFEYDGNTPTGGWGIYFNSREGENNQYIIFADLDGEKEYSGLAESNAEFGAKLVDLGGDIRVEMLKADNVVVDELNIVFLPPDPLTYINQEYIDIPTATIVLQNQATGEISTINVNFSGLIEVLD